MTLLTRHNHPASTIATGTVVLRQTIHGDTQHIVGQAGDGNMLIAVVQDLVVDLVGKDDQAMLAGDLQDPFQDLLRIQRPRRIVRVNDDDGLGELLS